VIDVQRIAVPWQPQLASAASLLSSGIDKRITLIGGGAQRDFFEQQASALKIS
jgi:hypothetical protein